MTTRPDTAQRWKPARHWSDRVPLRIKLITAVLAMVAIALVTISLAGISFLRNYLIGQQDANLRSQQTQQQAYQAVRDCLDGAIFPCPVGNTNGVAVDWRLANGQLQQALTPQRGFGADSKTIPGPAVIPELASLTARPGAPITVPAQSGNARWRVISFPVGFDGQLGSGTVIVGVDVSSVYNTVRRLTVIDEIVSVILLVGLATVGVAIVRTSLRPLSDIEKTAGKIASGDLSQRVPDLDPATEVGRLGQSLNTMLAQIESAFQARERSEWSARQSEERMRRFVADASHELRTPLTVIRGYAEYYRQRGGEAGGLSGGDVGRIMERVEKEATRVGGLVEDLLLLARMDQQRPVVFHAVDLLTLAVDAVSDAQTLAPGRDISLDVARGKAPLVLGDEAQLRQVVMNLMSNAMTHTPDGTPVEVRIATIPPEGTPPVPRVVLEVSDHGPGLTEDQAEHVFERFFRGDAARDRRTGGTGLGLAIVASIVTAHTGTVSVDSKPGQGATFRIALPLAPEAHEAMAEDS